MTVPVLGRQALNRATMARQLLLERADLPVESAVEHLVGLQAQEPLDPYLALWSRLRDFDPHELGSALEERRLVRIVAMPGDRRPAHRRRRAGAASPVPTGARLGTGAPP